MKKNIYTAATAIAASLGMAGCVQTPDVVVVTRQYKESFTSTFGEIPKDQDWKLATNTDILLRTGGRRVSNVNVYINACNNYYLAAAYEDIKGSIVMRVDIPKGIETLYVDIDGEMYTTTPWGTIDLNEPKRNTPSRAESFEFFDPADAKSLSWIIVAEDLGDTDDFDFNDVVMQIKYDKAPGVYAVVPDDWTLIVDDEDIDLSPSRADDYTWVNTKLSVKITALAAGGTLPIWLHYLDGKGTDYIISPWAECSTGENGYIGKGYIYASEVTEDNMHKYEWHQWFCNLAGSIPGSTDEEIKKYRINPGCMINTGGTGAVTNIIADVHSVTLPYSLMGDFTFENYSQSVIDGNEATNAVRGFYITVRTHKGMNDHGEINVGQVVGAAPTGEAPQMFLIPDIGWTNGGGYWYWPMERVRINDAYPTFPRWVKSHPTDTHSKLWYTEDQVLEGNDVKVFNRGKGIRVVTDTH